MATIWTDEISGVSDVIGPDITDARFVTKDGIAVRTVAEKGSDTLSVKDFGAVSDGDMDNSLALSALQTAFPDGAALRFPPGNYRLSSDVELTSPNIDVRIDPAVTFSGAGSIRFSNVIPYQGEPWSADLVSRLIGPEFNYYGNVFLRASYIKATGTTSAVATFGMGEAAANEASAWGGNFVAYATANGAGVIGVEINCGVLEEGGRANGLVVASAGEYPVASAIQMQSNNNNSQFNYGIRFNYRTDIGGFIHALIFCNALGSSEKGIDFSQGSFTSAEIDVPSFHVGATVASMNSRVKVTASATSTPRISVIGSATNANLELEGKGVGTVDLRANGIVGARIGSGSLTVAPASSTSRTTISDTGTQTAVQFDTAGNASIIQLRRAANTLSAPQVLASGATLGTLQWRGYDGSTYASAASIAAVTTSAPSPGTMPTSITFSTAPSSGGAPAEWLRITDAGALTHRSNSTIVIDAKSHLGLRSYTVSTLPSASPSARIIYVSDLVGGAEPCFSDGTNWRRFSDRTVAS